MRKNTLCNFRLVFGSKEHFVVTNDFFDVQFAHLQNTLPDTIVTRILRRSQLAGGNIRPNQRSNVSVFVSARYVITGLFVKMLFVGNSSRRHDANDVAGNHSFGGCRVFDLLAYSNLFSQRNKFGDIRVSRVIRHAAHRRTFFQTAIPAGQGQAQQTRSFYRIVKKHFVKVAQAVKNKAVLIFFLYRKIMLHHL